MVVVVVEVLTEQSINTCRGQDQRLQQVRQRDDAPHYVLPVHQHQPVHLGHGEEGGRREEGERKRDN